MREESEVLPVKGRLHFGTLTLDHIFGIRDAFKYFDVNADRAITKADLAALVKKLARSNRAHARAARAAARC